MHCDSGDDGCQKTADRGNKPARQYRCSRTDSFADTGDCPDSERDGICQRVREPGQSHPFLHKNRDAADNNRHGIYNPHLYHLRLFLPGRLHIQTLPGRTDFTSAHAQLSGCSYPAHGNGTRIHFLCMQRLRRQLPSKLICGKKHSPDSITHRVRRMLFVHFF